MKTIPLAGPQFVGNEENYVLDCLHSTHLSMGKYVSRFERELAGVTGREDAVACSNGTVALHLALMALGLKPGQLVIVPSYAFVAVANAVKYCGATPVFADCSSLDWNATPDAVEWLLNRWRGSVAGIIAVHTYGAPCDATAMQVLAKQHGCWLIEDAAEALGGAVDARPCGNFGELSTFSFYGNKTITCGEGGAVVGSKHLCDKMRLLRGQGQDGRSYWHPTLGYNYRLTDLQAAVALAQLEQLDIHLRAREVVCKWYAEYMPADLQQQFVTGVHSNWMKVILTRDTAEPVRVALAERGIQTRPGFTPIHRLPMYRFPTHDCYVADDVSRRAICLPTHGGVSEDDVQYVCDTLQEVACTRAA